MDPKANLKRQLEIAADIIAITVTHVVDRDGEGFQEEVENVLTPIGRDLGPELAKLVIALAQWRDKGGSIVATAPAITVTGFGFAPVNLTYEEWVESEIQDDEEAAGIARRMLGNRNASYRWNEGNEPSLYREFDICNEAALRAALASADQQEQDH